MCLCGLSLLIIVHRVQKHIICMLESQVRGSITSIITSQPLLLYLLSFSILWFLLICVWHCFWVLISISQLSRVTFLWNYIHTVHRALFCTEFSYLSIWAVVRKILSVLNILDYILFIYFGFRSSRHYCILLFEG